MKRSKELYKAIGNLELRVHICKKCNGKGKWIFFKTTGNCQNCYGIGMINGTPELYKQINEYIESGSLHIDEMLKHSHKVP